MNDESQFREIVIIGAGVCGIYTLHKMRSLGLDAVALERGGDLGGTWYWNRYPGARFDSESYTYGYSFDRDILDEWDWNEHFAAQPETLSYLNYVADKLNIRQHMRFGCNVVSAEFDEQNTRWRVTLESGQIYECTYLMTAIGMLSAATMPRIEGREAFTGEAYHTYYWPQEKVDFTNKRVAIIGTGATGVQVIGEIADKVGELTVYQRRPNWCAPLHNSPIDKDEMARIRSSYDEIFEQCAQTPGGFLHGPDRRVFAEVSEEEKLAFWEELYASPGFGVWLGNFREVLMEPKANAEYSEFIASKIRQRVLDPEVAEKLIPKDHGFGSRRVPMETNYYEAYNQDNVSLVDISETPIERITEKGICTTMGEREYDIIIYATGFDAVTGAFERIDIRGSGGERLTDKWRDGPITYLGLQVSGFPNLLTLAGPQGASVSSNIPPAIEFSVNWATDLITFMKEHGYERVEAEEDAEVSWIGEVKKGYEGSLFSTAKSWFTGYNSNIDRRSGDAMRYLIYLLGAPKYRKQLLRVATEGYEGLKFS